MANEMNNAKPIRGVWAKSLGPVLIGGVAGALASYFGMQAIESGAAGTLDVAAIAALAVALIYIMTALAVLIGAASPKIGSAFLNVEDADELREMRQNLLFSGIAMALFGVALSILALSSPGSILDAKDAMVASIVLLFAGAFAGFRSQRHADELMREVGKEAGNLSYYLSVLVIGGWALLAHAGEIPNLPMLSVLTIFWSIMLVSAFWVCGARGMLNRR